MKMTSLTFYGGIGEVGGNKILIETKKARLWFDFGLSFKKSNMYFDEFMQPRKINGLNDFIELGLVPWFRGLYRNDYVEQSGLKTSKLEFDGVFLTHPHADHFGNFDLLHKDMPLFMGEGTKIFLEAFEKTGKVHYLTYNDAFSGKRGKNNPWRNRPITTFRSGKTITVKDVKVTPIHVDHSIPGAYGYLIETPDRKIVYTGDFRLHGRKPEMSREFFEKAAAFKPDDLIIEGTRIVEHSSGKSCPKCGFVIKEGHIQMKMTEEEVKEKIINYIKETKDLVIANFPARDIDRFMTFYNACKATGRKLVIDLKQSYLIQQLEKDPIQTPKLRDNGLLTYAREKMLLKDWEKKLLVEANIIDADEINKNQGKYVFYCPTYNMTELVSVQPKKASIYIYSLCSPFNEEMLIDFNRLHNWIHHFKLNFKQAHASGHCSRDELKEAIERIKPKAVYPVHTKEPLEFKELAKNVEIKGVGEEIKL